MPGRPVPGRVRAGTGIGSFAGRLIPAGYSAGRVIPGCSFAGRVIPAAR